MFNVRDVVYLLGAKAKSIYPSHQELRFTGELSRAESLDTQAEHPQPDDLGAKQGR